MLKIMTFNIRHGLGKDIKNVWCLRRWSMADVVVWDKADRNSWRDKASP